MNKKTEGQINDILKRVGVESLSEDFLRQALKIDIPREDGTWLKSVFRQAVTFLELIFGTRTEANKRLPWLLFSLGVAYERNKYANRERKEGGK